MVKILILLITDQIKLDAKSQILYKNKCIWQFIPDFQYTRILQDSS